MKENGMNTLAELLNEYERAQRNEEVTLLGSHWQCNSIMGLYHIYCRNGKNGLIEETEHSELKIISKKYGFIKWLVENDKIKLGAYDYDGYHMNITNYKDLLMLLSIQDNPIEFLVSILK